MSRLITRRKVITTALTALGGASGLTVAARIADRYGLIPPDHGGLYGAGETLTYASHRLLTARGSLAREFRPDQISTVAPVNGPPPQAFDYQQLLRRGFTNWQLDIDGLVARPSSFSLAELRRFPVSRQITHQGWAEGWSFIAEWSGVPLSYGLYLVGADARAKYVVFYAYDDDWESIDMADAWHPQTLLAYGMNGADLPAGHGAPLRLRVPRQLGYKSIKYLAQITVVDSLKDVGDGTGSSAPGYGYSWYAGI
jgi:DMSO/TMAO reductase YedYZ molybdopterin-dependent catalytic subunit